MTKETIKELMKNFPYSKQAFADGYDFSEWSLEEQELTKAYYTNKKDMREANETYKSASYYISYGHLGGSYISSYDISWRFPESKSYFGIIVSCNKSYKKGSDDYILDIAISEDCIRHVKFNPHENSVIMRAIKEELSSENESDFYKLKGKWIQIDIKNNRNKGDWFSNVTGFVFYCQEEKEIYIKMFEYMFSLLKNKKRNLL